MKIVIAGAGDVGFHLAELLSYENQDIILIDNDRDVLKYASTHLDILSVEGDSSSIEVLQQAEVGTAQLFVAVTTNQNNNLVTAMLAKKMGAKHCIARVRNSEYLDEGQQECFKELGVDSLISPRSLASMEILRLIKQCTFTDVFEFDDGKMSLVGITLNSRSSLLNRQLSEVYHNGEARKYRPMAILRGQKTLMPNGDTILRKDDHVYFVSPKEYINELEEMGGEEKVKVKKIMIVGGTGLAYETAKLLENDYNITLIEKDKERCRMLAEHLSKTLIIYGEPSNTDLLLEEGLPNMDAFIALTVNSETNFIACLTAKNFGVHRTIAQVENKAYTHISQEIGVDTLINQKLIAANNIFRYVRKGKVESITSLHGVDAEVIEYMVHKKSQITKKPLKDLHFPDTARVGGVVRTDESYIPDGNFQLQKGDRVIVFAMPEAIPKLDTLFR